MSVVAIAQHRASGGRFAPGRSGNPAGRPKGARNKTTLLAEAVLGENGETLVQKAVTGALGGDGATLRFLLGRLLPPASGDQPVALDLTPGEENDPAAILAKAIRAMADGEITPKEALQIGRVLAIFAKLKRMSSPSPAKRPVSDLYFSREAGESKRPPPQTSVEPAPAGGGGQGGGNSASVEKAPVSDLYFSSRPSRSGLFSTTAIGLASGMAGRHGVESPRPGLPI
jgi:hypothetical protein